MDEYLYSECIYFTGKQRRGGVRVPRVVVRRCCYEDENRGKACKVLSRSTTFKTFTRVVTSDSLCYRWLRSIKTFTVRETVRTIENPVGVFITRSPQAPVLKD